MVKLAAFPKCWLEDITEGRMDLFDWIQRSVELGCDGLELYAGFLRSFDSGYLKQVRRRIESLGMSAPMMCYSPDFTAPDAQIRAKEIEGQKQMIRVTAELGGEFCRTLSGQARPEVSPAQGIEWVVSAIESCLPVATQCRVSLVIENHYKDGYWRYPEFAQKKEVFLPIVDTIDSPRFGVQFDPSNALVAGDDPLELLRAVVDRVMTMHASDRYLLPGHSLGELSQTDGTTGYASILQHGVTGKGLNDYDAIFGMLAERNFTGWVSIEDGVNGMSEMAESMAFLKKMRAKHFADRPSP